MKLLGATLLHTRYGHWQHPQSGRFFIKPVTDHLRHYPGLAEELLAIRWRALHDEHTVHDQQRIQWLSQCCFGALDIYQQGISLRAVSREEIIEEVEAWFFSAGFDEDLSGLAAALFAPILSGD